MFGCDSLPVYLERLCLLLVVIGSAIADSDAQQCHGTALLQTRRSALTRNAASFNDEVFQSPDEGQTDRTVQSDRFGNTVTIDSAPRQAINNEGIIDNSDVPPDFETTFPTIRPDKDVGGTIPATNVPLDERFNDVVPGSLNNTVTSAPPVVNAPAITGTATQTAITNSTVPESTPAAKNATQVSSETYPVASATVNQIKPAVHAGKAPSQNIPVPSATVPAPMINASITAGMTGTTQAGTRKASQCTPMCKWSCDSPECEEVCEPICEAPKCETRCSGLDTSGCSLECEQPSCMVICPERGCPNRCPHCTTKCAKPHCKLNCPNAQPCHNVCEEPRCHFKCRAPQTCPQPKCQLRCEYPKGCNAARQAPMPPPASGEVTIRKFTGTDNTQSLKTPLTVAPSTLGADDGDSDVVIDHDNADDIPSVAAQVATEE